MQNRKVPWETHGKGGSPMDHLPRPFPSRIGVFGLFPSKLYVNKSNKMAIQDDEFFLLLFSSVKL